MLFLTRTKSVSLNNVLSHEAHLGHFFCLNFRSILIKHNQRCFRLLCTYLYHIHPSPSPCVGYFIAIQLLDQVVFWKIARQMCTQMYFCIWQRLCVIDFYLVRLLTTQNQQEEKAKILIKRNQQHLWNVEIKE